MDVGIMSFSRFVKLLFLKSRPKNRSKPKQMKILYSVLAIVDVNSYVSTRQLGREIGMSKVSVSYSFIFTGRKLLYVNVSFVETFSVLHVS